MRVQEVDRRRHPGDYHPDDHRVMTFSEWCKLNSISLSTGQRIIGRGEVEVTRLSKRRIGITVRANREWQQSRVLGEV